jgi:hypothetical protein
MTAQVFTATVKPRGAFAAETEYRGIKIDATADTALAAITTASTIGEVLDILSACVGRNRVTAVATTGYATSVKN